MVNIQYVIMLVSPDVIFIVLLLTMTTEVAKWRVNGPSMEVKHCDPWRMVRKVLQRKQVLKNQILALHIQ